MNKLRLFLGALAALIVMSCSNSKTNISAAQFSENQVLVDGKPYTGEVWSDDGKTYRIDADKGEMVSFTLYHNNGLVAVSKTSHNDSTLVYDENGESIALDTFANRYKVLAKMIPQLVKKIKGEK